MHLNFQTGTVFPLFLFKMPETEPLWTVKEQPSPTPELSEQHMQLFTNPLNMSWFSNTDLLNSEKLPASKGAV